MNMIIMGSNNKCRVYDSNIGGQGWLELSLAMLSPDQHGGLQDVQQADGHGQKEQADERDGQG